jgi:hypothetical protein
VDQRGPPTPSHNHAHATVSAVSPPPGLGGLVHDDVLDDELIDGEVLGVGVGLGVLQQTEEELDRLDGPTTWTRVNDDSAHRIT